MKRCKVTGYIPNITTGVDGTYIYGYSNTNFYRFPLANAERGDYTRENPYTDPDSRLFKHVWAPDKDGHLFALMRIGSRYYLYRSVDFGDTWAEVYDFGVDTLYILPRGFALGYPNGVPTYAMAEYYTDASAITLKILTSTDGVNWTTASTIAGGGGGSEIIRHWHCIVWDPYSEQWFLSSGDISAASALFATADLTLIQNASLAVNAAIPGVSVAYGRQRHRVIDFLCTPDYVYTGTDNVNSMVEKGIWRWSHDLSFGERVDLGDARFETGSSRSTMWIGVRSSGHLLYCDYTQAAIDGLRFVSVYAADERSPKTWREAGRAYAVNTASNNTPQGMWARDGLIGLSFSRGCGKSSQGETALFRMDGEWTPDLIGTYPAAIGDKRMYRPEVLHPVYWAGGGGSATRDGYTPFTAFASLQEALTGRQTGTGAKAISTITVDGQVATVTTSAAHGYLVGDRVTLAGNDPVIYNKTYSVVTAPTATTFTIRVASGTGDATVTGTVDDIYSNITYGGAVIVSGDELFSASTILNVDKYPTHPVGASAGLQGFEGESVHPIQIVGQGRDVTHIGSAAALSSTYLIALNTTNDFVILKDIEMYLASNTSGHETILLAAANSKLLAFDADIGRSIYQCRAVEANTTWSGLFRAHRCAMRNDGLSGTTLLLSFVSASGTGCEVDLQACLLDSKYGCGTFSHANFVLSVVGCALTYASAHTSGAFTFNNANTDGTMKVIGNVFYGANIGAFNSGTAATNGGRIVRGNFFRQRPVQTRDRGIAGNFEMDQLGTTMADYFVDGDPLLGLKAGSPLIERSQGFSGFLDYLGRPRKNPSSIGHLEYRPGIRPAAATRPARG